MAKKLPKVWVHRYFSKAICGSICYRRRIVEGPWAGDESIAVKPDDSDTLEFVPAFDIFDSRKVRSGGNGYMYSGRKWMEADIPLRTAHLLPLGGGRFKIVENT